LLLQPKRILFLPNFGIIELRAAQLAQSAGIAKMCVRQMESGEPAIERTLMREERANATTAA